MSRARTVMVVMMLLLPLVLGGWTAQTDPPATDPPATDPAATDPPVTDAPVTTDEEECGLAAPPDAEFVGSITSIDDNLARFRVSRTVQGDLPGSEVTVIYGDSQERYLRVGTSYRVEVIRTGLGFTSALTAGECGNDPTTVHVDGSPVNTSALADVEGPLIRYAVEIVVIFLVIIGIIGLFAIWMNRARGDGDF